MSRPRSVPKYRKHRASGQAIVEINGKTYYLGPHNTQASHREFDRIVGEYLATGRASTFGSRPAERTIADVFLEFIRHAKKYYGLHRESKYHEYAMVVSRVSDIYGKTAAEDFGPLQFKAIRKKLVDNDLSRNYVNVQMKRLVRIFKWAAGEGLISPTIPQTLSMIEGLRKGRTEARETEAVKPVAPDQVDAVLANLPPMVADIVRVQRLTGTRPAELCNLRISDIDRSGSVWTACLSEHKNAHRGKSRTIYIGPKAQSLLNPYLASAESEYVFCPKTSENRRRSVKHAARKTPLSCGNRPGLNCKKSPKRSPGERYEVSSYRRAIHRACDTAKIERWSPNQLRHLYATEIRKDHGLEAASILLGHAKPDTTLIYAERDETKAKEIAAKVG
jgi:integrase